MRKNKNKLLYDFDHYKNKKINGGNEDVYFFF